MTKEILITGCSSGIGLSVARGLKDRGYRVFATARQETDVARLRREGLESFPLDLTSDDSITGAVTRVLQETGGTLYALFNNAGYGQTGALEDLPREALREQFETNVFGTHELTRQVLPVMRRQGYGRIIQNSSIMGLVAFPFRGAYVASKFAMEGLTDALRRELYDTPIEVVLIEPGPILSRFRKNARKAFEKHVQVEKSVHQEVYRKIMARLEKEGAVMPFTLPPEAVLRKLIHALESPRPRPRYYVTTLTWIMAAAKRLLPFRWLDRFVKRLT
jgi:NAD(P)-dependent dehydrogenase (short-subunit alcohol dehydrogenase family)